MFFKRDFKPDKLGSGWLSKLYLTKQQRRSLLKWILYGAVLVLLSVVQDVVMCRFRIRGATTDLVPCCILLICVLEGAESGCVFALAASLFYLFSGSAPGPYVVIFLTALGTGVAILRQAYLQKGIVAALICTGLALVVYEMAVFAIGLFLELTYPGRWIGFLITVGLSLLAVPVLYPLCLGVAKIGGQIWKE